MSASNLARRFTHASGISSGRVYRALLVTLVFLLLPVAADAYTLVLRSGRQVNVPDNFEVTHAAVIYEASPGFSVTVWLTNVDTAATERANAEPAGSFARRIDQKPNATTEESAQAESRPARRVLTNKELEPLRLKREAQEAEYERTRRARGMPSKQELQQRIEEQDRRQRESNLQAQAERAEAELESVKSELLNVRQNLNELNSRQAGAYAPAYVYTNYYPYYYAPPVQYINRLPFGRRGGFGRGNFSPHTHGRVRPYNPSQGFPFPALVTPTVNGSTPLVMAPAMPIIRH